MPKMVKALLVNLAGGGEAITDGECWYSEEVAADEIEVPEGTLCSLCGEPIKG